MPNPCPKFSLYLVKTLRPVPVITAASDTVGNMIQLHLAGSSLPIVIISIPFSFIYSLGLDNKFWLGGISEITYVIEHGDQPEEWAKVNDEDFKKLLAVSLAAGTVGLYVAFSDSIQSYYFNAQIPSLLGFIPPLPVTIIIGCAAIIVAIATGLSAILNDGLETLKWGREVISPDPIVYTSNLSRHLSQGISIGLGVANGIVDFYNATTIVQTLDIGSENLFARYLLTALSCVNGIGDYASRGRFLRDSLDTFIGAVMEHYRNKTLPDRKTRNALGISVAGSAFFAYLTWQISTFNLKSSLDTVGLYDYNNTTIPTNQTDTTLPPNQPNFDPAIYTTDALVSSFVFLIGVAIYYTTATLLAGLLEKLIVRVEKRFARPQTERFTQEEKQSFLQQFSIMRAPQSPAGSDSNIGLNPLRITV